MPPFEPILSINPPSFLVKSETVRYDTDGVNLTLEGTLTPDGKGIYMTGDFNQTTQASTILGPASLGAFQPVTVRMQDPYIEEEKNPEPPVQIIEEFELVVDGTRLVLKNATQELIQSLTKILTQGPEKIPEDDDDDEL